ncbi:SSU ribosomal protein S17E [Methanothermus fervidus DSM 2088]|uniref:Small ribosomal subunit protein eS17 n=1 Tax=Methanothermus fervidus (strain ATCC 43054 / DSM 2088 / JCM 10308 / V24 S) TaxID=523846 RepID=E3GYU5_METFV|nr:30S ribosomal protein S17e [Methanothermus fervidus]ADP77477.1 SSU ribosomal protein S17E [Methanothermus fervidus DSM 2088]
MGNIRTALIKRVAKELIETFPDKFSDNFDENKAVLEEISTVETKHLRNKIAGYITKLMKQRSS